MLDIDIDDFAAPVPPATVQKRRINGKFLRGPIAWVWLEAAARLPGKALHIAVFLRLWQGIKQSDTLRLNLSRLKPIGVSRDSGRRGLAALEKANLVSVKRGKGRCPVVKITEVPSSYS